MIVARRHQATSATHDASYGFDASTPARCSRRSTSSRRDIAMGVDTGGAGDQGMMFGYACTRDDRAHADADHARASPHASAWREVAADGHPDLRAPDGKSQVTVEYDDGKPVARRHRRRLDAAQRRASTNETDRARHHRERHQADDRRSDCTTRRASRITSIPTGRFVVGGPQGDAGLTGRKIIVDTYGGMGRHGGGAFSRQGPDEGRPLGVLHGALHREEHRRRRSGANAARCSSPTRSAWPTRSRCCGGHEGYREDVARQSDKLVRETSSPRPRAVIMTISSSAAASSKRPPPMGRLRP